MPNKSNYETRISQESRAGTMNVNNEVNPYQILNEKEKLRKGFVYKELELQGNGEKGRR